MNDGVAGLALSSGRGEAELRIELFGRFRVVVGGRTVPDEAWRRRRPAALLKLLALAPGHRLHREQVMDALWPELGPRAAAANLRKAVHDARRSLGAEAGADLLVSAGELLCLPSERLSVDVEVFRVTAAAARRDGDADAYSRAVELYRDGLLPEDRYEEWATGPRDELRLEWLAILEELAGLLEGRAELDEAARVVRLLVAAEPLQEESHAWLMRLHALAGHRGEALRQYDRLCELLESELGTEPSPETQRLFEEIRGRQAVEPELTSELWERVGDLRSLSGDAAGAAKAFEQALAGAESSNVEARLRRKCAGAWLMQHAPDQAQPHIEAAGRLTSDPAERGRLVCLRANLAWERGDLAEAQRLAAQACVIARDADDADDLAAAYEALAIVSHLKGDWRQGSQAQIERLAIDGKRAGLGRVFDIHHCIGQYQLYGDGLLEDVESHARRILGLAEEAGSEPAQAFAWCLLGESLLLHAHWDEAAACLERSCELYGSVASRSVPLPWQRRAELAVCVGAHDEVDSYLRRAMAIATVTPLARHAWGRVYATAAFAAVERGEPEAAARSVRAAATTAARYGDCPTCGALLNPIAAEAFVMLGDGDSARRYAESAARVAASFDSSAWRAMAQSAAGSVAIADGDANRARRSFEAAADLYERAQQPFWAKRSAAQAIAS